jgi:Fe-S cluster biogenesis protein NfuA
MNGALQARIRKIDVLAQNVNAAPDAPTRSSALELVQTIMEFHGQAIDRMMEIIADAGEAGWAIIDSFTRDELVANVLLLHGLHPDDLDTRVRGALETVRPYLNSHGGNVELVEIADGVVRLRLVGSCEACPSSAVTLKTAIEKAVLEAAPDVASIECHTATA